MLPADLAGGATPTVTSTASPLTTVVFGRSLWSGGIGLYDWTGAEDWCGGSYTPRARCMANFSGCFWGGSGAAWADFSAFLLIVTNSSGGELVGPGGRLGCGSWHVPSCSAKLLMLHASMLPSRSGAPVGI